MKNLLHYVRHTDKTFEELPFNRADALVLCWLSYFNFPDYLCGSQPVAIKNLRERGLLSDKEMFSDTYTRARASKKMFAVLENSKRFSGIKLSSFRSETDDEKVKQFAALCVEFLPDTYFIAFKGTGVLFTGWKEDLNLACTFPIPSQQSAEKYLIEQMRLHANGRFFVGGHSKGGNVALYASVNLPADLQEKIIQVFSFEGPGYMRDIYSDSGYLNIKDRVVKLVPNASFVGMLLEKQESFLVIKSKALSLLQHDPFFWVIKNNDFCYVKRRTRFSVRLERALNVWVDELSFEERERVLALIYSALNSLDTNDVCVLFKQFYRQIPALFKSYKRFESDDKKFFKEKGKRLFSLIIKKQKVN